MNAVKVVSIPASVGMDQITLYVHDIEPGRGHLTVECYGCAWACFWGAMGNGSTVLQFVSTCDAGYIANCLIRGRRQFISNRRNEERELLYLTKICGDVIRRARATLSPQTTGAAS